MGTVFFFLTIFVLPGLPSGALVGRWALLAIVSAVLLYRVELSKGAWVLLGYLAVMSWWAPVAYEAINLYCHAVFLVILYCYGRQVVPADTESKPTDTKPNAMMRRVAIGVGLGIAVNSAIVIAQHYVNLGWIPQITPDGGLYFNRNIATEGAAMALALVVGYRLWWLIPGILPTLYYGSRAPVLALGVTGMMAIWRRSAFLGMLTILGSLLAVFGFHWDYTHTVLGPLGTMQERFGTWYDGMHGFTVLGQGLGSWITNFPIYQTHSNALELRWENAHNDVVQLIFEFGAVGAVMVAAFVLRLATSARVPEFYALVVFAVTALFGFPLYQPVTGAVAALCAGYLFRSGVPLRDTVVRLGLSVRSWLAKPSGRTVLQGSETIPAEPGSAFGTGLSYYHSTRLRPHGPDSAGAQV